MRTTQQLRNAWAPPCEIRKATFHFWTGVAVTVDARVMLALAALDRVLKRHGYKPKDGETWGYNCRKITGGTGYSLHAYGIAVDVNSRTNPYGSRLVTDMPKAMVAEIKAIRTMKDLPVWRWGGDYGGNKDAMHFEIVASPAELAAGIRTTEQEEDDMTPDERTSLKNVEASVNHFQEIFNEWDAKIQAIGSDGGAVDIKALADAVADELASRLKD